MSTATRSLRRSPLRAVAERARTAGAAAADERCELCAQVLAPDHRHLLDVRAGELLCTCGPCAVLFDRAEAGGGHYRAVPRTARRVADLDLDDVTWGRLDVPVGLAFFVVAPSGEQVTAWYPNPLGMTSSSPDPAAWRELCEQNRVVSGMEAAVEALLVSRRGPAPEHWVAPIDVCYRLAALVRRRWEGFTGGGVWDEIETFFDGLRRGARTVDRQGRAVQPAPVS